MAYREYSSMKVGDDRMATTAKRKGCKITVILKIEFFGPNASQNLIDGWETDIQDIWNGREYKCCPVNFNVITRLRAAGDPATSGFHQIEIVAGPQTSYVTSLGPDSTSGRWDSLDTGEVAAHESGHLMGLEDEYSYDSNGNYVNENPQPTDPQSIMAQTWGTVDALQEHIDEVIRKTTSWWKRLWYGVLCRFCCIWKILKWRQ